MGKQGLRTQRAPSEPRSLLIPKSRGAKHSSRYRQFPVTEGGIEGIAMPGGARSSEPYTQASMARSHAGAQGRTGGEQ